MPCLIQSPSFDNSSNIKSRVSVAKIFIMLLCHPTPKYSPQHCFLIHPQSVIFHYGKRLSLTSLPTDRGRYMGHFINNAQGDQTVEWMIQSQWKLFQLQLTWGSSTYVFYFPSIHLFELASVRHGVCGHLGYCDSWRSKIIHQDRNLM